MDPQPAVHVLISGAMHPPSQACAAAPASVANLELAARCAPDPVVTPARAALIPGCAEAIEAARGRGALLSGISGSGPALFSICRSAEQAEEAAEAMKLVFARQGVEADALISPADNPGALGP